MPSAQIHQGGNPVVECSSQPHERPVPSRLSDSFGRERQKAAESGRPPGVSGWDERTAAALAPRLAPRCSAPFCSRLETFCSVSHNGPSYSEMPQSLGTCC
ncbi:uncharacterized protein GJ701_007983 [Geothlypis trichas]